MCRGWQVVDPGQGCAGASQTLSLCRWASSPFSSGCSIPSLHLCPLSARSPGQRYWPLLQAELAQAVQARRCLHWCGRSRERGDGTHGGRWAIVALHLGCDDEVRWEEPWRRQRTGARLGRRSCDLRLRAHLRIQETARVIHRGVNIIPT